MRNNVNVPLFSYLFPAVKVAKPCVVSSCFELLGYEDLWSNDCN